jgi:regulation of enolase protein 1 (concanavalin A-like superfamily)
MLTWSRRTVGLVVAMLAIVPLAVSAAFPSAGRAAGSAGPALAGAAARIGGGDAVGGLTYTNPVGDDAAENFADPTVIRGRDGYWYAYATGDPRFAGDTYRRMKIARSADLVRWEYVGDVFSAETEPRYDGYGDAAVRMYWAPDVEYFGGRYLLYYSYVVNVGTDRHWRAIGVATAPAPAGPWTDSGAFVTGPETWEPRPGVEAWRNVIDPEVVATPDGTRYLYYGSVNGGVRVVRLSADGLTAVGDRRQVTPENRFEAAHLVHRDGYYYLFLSAIGGCCAGPVSAYPVHIARARTPLGPFVDRNGASVLDRNAGGTPVQVPNGNRWVSVGHNTLATDVAGQQWLVTHGIDRHKPYLQGTANARHLVISRLDWIDGWPVARAGLGLPDGPTPAPATATWIADSFESGEPGSAPGSAWHPASGWQHAVEPSGGHVVGAETEGERVLTADRRLEGDARVRGTVRLAPGGGGSAGFVLESSNRAGGGERGVRVLIDRESGAFVLAVRRGHRAAERHAQRLPAGFAFDDWHEVDVRVRGRQVTAELTEAGLDDPLATVRVRLPHGHRLDELGLATSRTGAAFDDITAAPLFEPVTDKVPDPVVGRPVAGHGEEFDGDLGASWSWVREPAATVDDGQLVFPVQQADLVDRAGEPNTASLLLREPPDGTWTVETKVTVPFGDSYPLGWPQVGLLAYVDDNHFVNLSDAALNRTRHVSFGKEMPWADNVVYADARLGPTADTMWLRLRHHVDAASGEHHYRAATSTDGRHWVWHGVRVLPPGPSPRIGLAAFGSEEPGLTARFDYLRFRR